MANKRLLLRRGTTAENDAFTGADGEITYDTQGKNLRLHDGVTAGGTTLTAGAQADGVTDAIQTTDGSGNLTDSGVIITDAVISSTSSTFAIGTASNPADGFFDVVNIGGATLSVDGGNLQLGGEDILTSPDLVTATTQTSGIVQLSTPGLASAGSDSSTAMTPELVRQEIDSRVNVALTSAVQYKGTFEDSTLWDSDGNGTADNAAINEGDLYYFAGTSATTIFGVTFNTGDHLIWGETVASGSTITSSQFDKIDNTDSVSSVNGDVGAVEVDIESALEVDSNVLAAHTLTFSDSSSALVINKVQSNSNADLLLSADGTGDVTLVGDGTNVGSLKFKCEDTTSEHNVTIKSPDHAAFSAGSSYDLTLPAVAPTDGQVLTSTSNGTLSWGTTESGGFTYQEHTSVSYTVNVTDSTNNIVMCNINSQSGQTTTIPVSSSVSDGTVITLRAGFSTTVEVSGNESIRDLSGTLVSSIPMERWQTIVLVKATSNYLGTYWNQISIDNTLSDSFAYERVTVAPATLALADKTSKLFALGASGTYQLPTPAASNSGSTVVVKAETGSINIQSSSGIVLLNNATSTSTSTNPIAVTQVMSFVSTGSSWIQTSIEENDLNGLNDVDIIGAQAKQVLTYSSSGNWVNYNYTIQDLNDVSSTASSAAQAGEVLTWNGSEWAPAAAAGGGGGGSVPTVFSNVGGGNITLGSTTIAPTDSTIDLANASGYTPSGIEEIFILNQSQVTIIGLPLISGLSAGYKYNIKNLSTHNLDIYTSSPTIIKFSDNNSNTFTLQGGGSSVTLVADTANNRWHII